ncbi:TolC family protein [Massilia sp. H-1]|nr:TolC family protein [Massilia sp. H-1]
MSLLASGCTTLAPDGGFGTVSGLAKSRLGMEARVVRSDADQRALDAAIGEKLAKALSAEDAVQIALLNNRSLQATYLEVGIAQADLVQAGRLQNPSFTFQRTHAGADVGIERSLTFSLVSALTTPLAKRIEGRRFEETRLRVAHQMLVVVGQTRRAHVEAVAAIQGLDYARQVSRSAQASAELTGRMARVGNSSQLDLAREQAFYAETTGAVGRGDAARTAAREKLTRLMGLWGTGAPFILLKPDCRTCPRLPSCSRTWNASRCVTGSISRPRESRLPRPRPLWAWSGQPASSTSLIWAMCATRRPDNLAPAGMKLPWSCPYLTGARPGWRARRQSICSR